MAGLMYPVIGGNPNMSQVPQAQQQPDLMQMLGMPQGRVQGQMAPVQPAAPAQAPVQEPAPERDWWANLKDDPAKTLALLQFAGQALKPRGAGDSQASILGDALSSAVGTFSTQRKNEQGNDRTKDKIAENKRQDKESNPSELKNMEYLDSLINQAKAKAEAQGGTFDEKVYALTPTFIKKYANELNISEQSAEIEIMRALLMKETTQSLQQKSVANAAENMAYSPEQISKLPGQIGELGPKKLPDPGLIMQAEAWDDARFEKAYRQNAGALIDTLGLDYVQKRVQKIQAGAK